MIPHPPDGSTTGATRDTNDGRALEPMKLDDDDLVVLSRLGTGPRDTDALAADLGVPGHTLRRQMAALIDDGLAVWTDDGRVQRTESGRRVLRTAGGSPEDWADTSPAAERVLDRFDLDPATADAVRSAYELLRYWGRATPAEVVDAVYPEIPAGYATAEAWWVEGVREPLAALPDIAPVAGLGVPWRYLGQAEVRTPVADGLRPAAWVNRRSTSSVVRAVETADCSPATRRAVRRAFALLLWHGPALDAELRREVATLAPPGTQSLDTWWTRHVAPVLERLPGVRRVDGTWRYER